MLISLIIPVYNEEESVKQLHAAVKQALDQFLYETIFVDDGSHDNSFEVLAKIAKGDDTVRVIQMRRNFGQTAAIAAGIDHAHGDVIVLLDADLQNDPVDIPMMLTKMKEGYDVVSGWRIHRQDEMFTRRIPSQMANALISWVTGVHLHDYGCTLKAYRREVLTGFRLYGEMHRFLPAYASAVGAKIIEVPVNHHARKFGKSKYGLNRVVKVLLDLMTVKFMDSYAAKPMQVFGSVGLFLIVSSFVSLSYLIYLKLVTTISMIQSPILLLTAMLFILGFQSILMGLLAELVVRTYYESQNKPTYTVRRTINIESK